MLLEKVNNGVGLEDIPIDSETSIVNMETMKPVLATPVVTVSVVGAEVVVVTVIAIFSAAGD